jgi:Tol biopolymer transport system component
MGEVYRARDRKLQRDVAVKVLPEGFAQDAQRLARFEREARTLAALNHPNIAAIYGVEEVGGVNALVMELVEGPTLADRLAHGAIPADEALLMARQLADALEAAHEHGIIHRDLKPANIKVREDGTVKILDFGLAKAIHAGASGLSDDVSNSPTLTARETEMGAIVGTAAYMAPEQARGKAVDKRADIWSFGVVLYEMLVGRRLFAGPTLSDTLAAVLKTEPDLTRVPVQARRIVERCLRQDLRQRWQAIGDVRIAIEETLAGETAEPASVPPRRNVLRWALFLLALAVAGVLASAGVMNLLATPPESPLVRFTIVPPANGRFGIRSGGGLHLAVSPDGKNIVFAGRGDDGKVQLWLRSLDSTVPRPLAGTGSAAFPFWKPDGKSIGFFAGGKLWRMDLTGGPAIFLADAPDGRGGTWNDAGVIVFCPGLNAPLYTVAEAGGAVSTVTRPDAEAGENDQWLPWFLPDGRHFLYAKGDYRRSQLTIRIGSLASPEENRVLQDADSSAVYAQGHLLFLRGTTLMARSFDAKRLEFTGEAVPVAERVRVLGNRAGGESFSVSSTGLLVYAGGAVEDDLRLTWFDRTGKRLRVIGDPGNLGRMDLSPDGNTVAVAITDRGNTDIATCDALRGLCTKLTTSPALDDSPVWSSESDMIVFRSFRSGRADLFRKPADGSGPELSLYADELYKWPNSFSPDGTLAYVTFGAPKSAGDIWFLRDALGPAGTPKPAPFLQSDFYEGHVQFSADGKWIAYESNESSIRVEIYVVPSSGRGKRVRVSASGGWLPRWRGNGKELFYIGPDERLMSAGIEVIGTSLQVGKIEALFGGLIVGRGFLYDVSPDGQHVLAVVPPEGQPEELTVVMNFTAGLTH